MKGPASSARSASASLPRERLRNQLLAGTELESPRDVVAWMGALQAQDLPGVGWAVAQRTRSSTVAEVMDALDSGAILRTHVLRPTWHLVAREDLRWLLERTAPRVLQRSAPYLRQVGLDVLRKLRSRMARVLRGQSLTRGELARQLDEAPTGNRLAWVLLDAELHGVLCSGPRSGNQQTYALLDERVPTGKALDAEEALARLATVYFRARAPARLEDLAWWASLTREEAVRASELAGLHAAGGDSWRLGARSVRPADGVSAVLLSTFDEYFFAYRERGDVLDPRLARRDRPAMFFLVDGVVAGTWRVTRTAREARVTPTPTRTLSAAEQAALALATQRYSAAVNASQPRGS